MAETTLSPEVENYIVEVDWLSVGKDNGPLAGTSSITTKPAD
jgi:hypothetical protein